MFGMSDRSQTTARRFPDIVHEKGMGTRGGRVSHDLEVGKNTFVAMVAIDHDDVAGAFSSKSDLPSETSRDTVTFGDALASMRKQGPIAHQVRP